MVHKMHQNFNSLSFDQDQALSNVLVILERAGINLRTGQISAEIPKTKSVHALIGSAGSVSYTHLTLPTKRIV